MDEQLLNAHEAIIKHDQLHGIRLKKWWRHLGLNRRCLLSL
jgi:hypothetical protein